MQLKFHMAAGQWAKASTEYERIIATASTGAIRDVGRAGRDAGRKTIAAAGFSQRWQRSLVVKFKPPRGISLDPSAYIHSTINYADVFETGKVIHGDPYLWLPLPNVPPFKGRPHMTPKQYIENVGPLITMRRPGKAPLLGAPVKGKVQLGRRITRGRFTRGASVPRSETHLVPMFFGVRSITIPKKFSVHDAIENEAKKISERYLAHLEPYEGRK